METAIGAVAPDRTAQPEPTSPLPIIIVKAEMPASMLSAYECGLYDEEPIFVSDEVILWGVSMSDVDDVLERCRKYYGVALTLEERQHPPLWKLLRLLDERGRLGDIHDGCYGKTGHAYAEKKGRPELRGSAAPRGRKNRADSGFTFFPKFENDLPQNSYNGSSNRRSPTSSKKGIVSNFRLRHGSFER